MKIATIVPQIVEFAVPIVEMESAPIIHPTMNHVIPVRLIVEIVLPAGMENVQVRKIVIIARLTAVNVMQFVATISVKIMNHVPPAR